MTANKKGLGSDLAKVDAYVNTPADYDELPDMSDRDPAEGTTDIKELVRRGRPPMGVASKQQVTLRLDPAIVEAFKAAGPGWQTRMNDTLARAAKRLKAAG